MSIFHTIATIFTLFFRILFLFIITLCDIILHPRIGAKRPSLPSRVAVIGGGIAGASAAYSLRASGVSVDLYEASDHVGGNAKTHTWSLDGVITGLSVLAWPKAYFRNYSALLQAFNVPVTAVSLPFYVARADGKSFAHGEPKLGLSSIYALEISRWKHMVSHVRAVNNFLGRRDGGPMPSLYLVSFFNPFNVIPLRFLSRLYGCGSTQFWDDLIVPLYSSSFLTTELDGIPSVIVPIIYDMIPVDASSSVKMESWSGREGSALVFEKLLDGVRVFSGSPVELVEQRYSNGQWAVHHSNGSSDCTYDSIIFACGARATADALRGAPLDCFPTASLLYGISYCSGRAFDNGIVHSHAKQQFPVHLHEKLLHKFANYIVAHNEPRRYENTFILSSWVPSASSTNIPRLVTYDARDPDSLSLHSEGNVINKYNHPQLSLCNMTSALMLRLVQGRRGLYFCGSYATPGNGHDLSLCSGLAVACALGAAYPFAKNAEAAADFSRLRRLMGL